MAEAEKPKRVKKERGRMVRTVLPQELEDKLRAMAAADNRTLSAMIAILLEEAVNRRKS